MAGYGERRGFTDRNSLEIVGAELEKIMGPRGAEINQ
jgi:hypothetical protein